MGKVKSKSRRTYTAKAKAKKRKSNKKIRYTVDMKLQAVVLHEQNNTCDQIQQWFRHNKGINIPKSTISTWYNQKNLIKMAKVENLEINNRETCINPKQRPRIMWDMESVLKSFMKKR